MTKVMFVIGIFVSVSLADGYFNLEGAKVGSSCENYGTPGVCKTVKNCPFALNNLRRYRDHNLTRCGFRKFDEIVCCPDTVEKNPGQSIPVHETTRKRYERVCEEIINRTKFVIRPFVIGGEDSLQNEFPHMAALGYNNSDSGELDWRCAASIISDRFLLTAAHCVAGPEPARARIGVTRLNDTDGLDIDIGKIISHPSWDGLDRFDDIALVQLARKLDFNERIRPACLYTANDDPDELIVTGWGKTTASGESTAPVLQKAKLRPVPIEKCTARYIEASLGTRRVISKQICTTAFSDGSLADACGGDSGGPVQSMHRYGAYKIVGIVSYGANCGSGSIPSVNTRISSYLDWIEDNVWPK